MEDLVSVPLSLTMTPVESTTSTNLRRVQSAGPGVGKSYSPRVRAYVILSTRRPFWTPFTDCPQGILWDVSLTTRKRAKTQNRERADTVTQTKYAKKGTTTGNAKPARESGVSLRALCPPSQSTNPIQTSRHRQEKGSAGKMKIPGGNSSSRRPQGSQTEPISSENVCLPWADSFMPLADACSQPPKRKRLYRCRREVGFVCHCTPAPAHKHPLSQPNESRVLDFEVYQRYLDLQYLSKWVTEYVMWEC